MLRSQRRSQSTVLKRRLRGAGLQHTSPEIHFSRLKKVSIHEFGHNLGLPHCPNKRCVMTDAVENITTIDNANFDLCEKCKMKI